MSKRMSMNIWWYCAHSMAGESIWYSDIRDYSITHFYSEMNVEVKGNLKIVIEARPGHHAICGETSSSNRI